jgi:hypothetical protein
MRTLVLTIALALGLACGSPTGNAPASIAGTWSDQASAPADSVTIMTLSQTNALVTGTVTIGSTQYDLRGTYHPPRVQLVYMVNYSGTPGLAFVDGTALSPTTIQVMVGSEPTRRFIKQ